MNTFFVFSAILAVAIAGQLSPVAVSIDTLGNYNLAYNIEGEQGRTEHANEHNELVGSYRFIDTDGHHHEIHYTSGKAGFIATGESIPRAPLLTPEVARAAYEHKLKFEEIARKLPVHRESEHEPLVHHFVPIPTQVVHFELPTPEYRVPHYVHHHQLEPVTIVNGVPVETAEVQHAKALHLEAHREAIAHFIH